MEDLAASILAPTVESAIKNLGAVIKRHFIYLCCFSGNISGLEVEAVKLDNAIEGLRARVEAATNNVEDIDPEVSFWLSGSHNMKEETTKILNEARNVESGCLRVAARFTLSKRAVKTAIAMVQQRENYSFNNISLPPRIAASRAIPLGTTSAYEFESRKKIEESIMIALRDKKENMIGICGMGGLGKTTLAKRIMNMALEEKVFEEVVMAIVSQQVDELKIQLEISDSLGLDLKEKSSQARVQKLHERLAGKKKILLVLDDVWTSLNLNNLGIPCDDDSRGCIILITSRNSDALSAMNVKKIFRMEHLSEEDAWFLFRKKVGTCVNEGKLSSTAKKVVEECNGLPIALATVGAALKDEKDMRIWKNALKQLRKPNPNSTPDFIAEVYNSIKVSYDKLNPEEARSLLLLCCLFPEDSNISIDMLSCFCMGLRLFEDTVSLEETRDTTWTLIKTMKDRSLLLDSEKIDYVRMHDVVRDVCVFISKKKGYIGGSDRRWEFSSRQRTTLSTPNLHLLSLKEVDIDDTLFEGIRELEVLSIESCSLTSLPKTTQLLKNLRTLRLYDCPKMETISIVGDLVNLEILICKRCNWVTELPLEIKRLNRLKLLELYECTRLVSIGRGIISSLVGLEELKMILSFRKWEGDDGDGENAGLRELESLTNLRCLEIEIADTALAAQNMQISSKLERFKIYIPPKKVSFNCDDSRILALHWKGGIRCLGNWIEMQLLRDTECLYLTGKGAKRFDSKNMQNIKGLVLGGCETVNNIVFPLIEDLSIFSLKKQENIWDVPISLFTNLRFIYISDCPRLHNLGQLSIVGDVCLPQLESVNISECEMMEQVFLCSEDDQHKNISGAQDRHITKLLFHKLKNLSLTSLPNLTTLCQGIEGIEFPQLKRISISECPKMLSITSTTSLNGNIESSHNNSGGDNNTVVDDHHYHSHLFWQLQKAVLNNLKKIFTDQNPFWGYKMHASSFNGLEDLYINGYRGSKSLFTSSMTENLVSLRELRINSCDEISQVIEDDKEKGGERNCLFPNLKILMLKGLSKLVTFCEWECDIEMPSLTTVSIEECSNMKYFSLGSLTAPKWQELKASVTNCLDVVAKVTFDNMKNLDLRWFENPLCHYKINVSLFNGLERLEITMYHSSMSLLTSSLAENLVNLKHLKVSNCDEMSKVIEDGEGEEEEDKVWNLPVFPKLEKIELLNLPKLVSFWEWRSDVEWPLLRKVDIYQCPNMTTVTLGPITTPNLTSVRINFKEYFDTAKNLNSILQQATIQFQET